MIVTGTDFAMELFLEKLKENYKVLVEMGNQINFLMRILIVKNNFTKIQISNKYLDNLVTLFGGIKSKRVLGELVLDEKLIEDGDEVSKFRSGVDILAFLADE